MSPNEPPFRPRATYDPDGDCIEVVLAREAFEGQFVSPHLTVYVGRESGLVVGCLVDGVSAMVRAAGPALVTGTVSDPDWKPSDPVWPGPDLCDRDDIGGK